MAIPEDLIAHFVVGPMTAEAVQDATMAFKKVWIELAPAGRSTSATAERQQAFNAGVAAIT
jgi:hypothetical protein